MIHFFPRFARDAASTPFGTALRDTGVEHRIFSVFVTQSYRHRIGLLLLGYPALAWAALGAARRSLLGRDGPPPDAVVISSDVEALAFALVRCWPGAAKARIVLMPFIFTARRSEAANRLRLAYYRVVMRRVSLAICHSQLEISRYQALFAGCGTAFVFVRWGGYVPTAASIEAEAGPLPVGGPPRVVAAGRSGRDYPTLVAAAQPLGCKVAIVCNAEAALAGVAEGAAVEVLRNCFGLPYLWQLLAADVVVVPLAVADISAGQMVLIQAMALGRPLVVTQTPTVGDYVTDGESALLVPLGDPAAMQSALQRLLTDRELATRLGRQAQAYYRTTLSLDAHTRGVIQAVLDHCGIPWAPAFSPPSLAVPESRPSS